MSFSVDFRNPSPSTFFNDTDTIFIERNNGSGSPIYDVVSGKDMYKTVPNPENITNVVKYQTPIKDGAA